MKKSYLPVHLKLVSNVFCERLFAQKAWRTLHTPLLLERSTHTTQNIKESENSCYGATIWFSLPILFKQIPYLAPTPPLMKTYDFLEDSCRMPVWGDD